MRGTRFLIFLSLMAAPAWLPPVAAAGRPAAAYEDDLTEESAGLDARVLTNDHQLQMSLSGGYDGAGGYGCGGAHEASCGCDVGGCGCDCCCDPCCRSTGLIAGAEFVYLKPHNSSGTGFNTFGLTAALTGITGATAGLNLPVDPDFHETGRFWVGWQRGDGPGVRARYWEYDHRDNDGAAIAAGTLFAGVGVGVGTVLDVFHAWDVKTFDLEYMDTFNLGCWDATWSAGVRYVEYEEERGLAPLAGTAVRISALKYFSGIGLTTSFEVRRQLTTNLGVFANGRYSILMDDENNTLAIAVPGVVLALQETQINDVKSIYETQIGVEWTRPICSGGYYFARVGAEMQYWNNFGVVATALVDDATAGFGGFFASVGLNR